MSHLNISMKSQTYPSLIVWQVSRSMCHSSILSHQSMWSSPDILSLFPTWCYIPASPKQFPLGCVDNGPI